MIVVLATMQVFMPGDCQKANKSSFTYAAPRAQSSASLRQRVSYQLLCRARPAQAAGLPGLDLADHICMHERMR